MSVAATPVKPQNKQSGPEPRGTWLSHWDPENEASWAAGGSRLAWRTLTITTANLLLAFVIWFLVSALVVRLPALGFQLTTGQLFWLAAMPGLAGGTLRLVHMFLVPIYGTRSVVGWSTLSLLLPALGWFFAVQNPQTPFAVLMGLAFLAGLGGGNFSSFMPSTSLFFPKRLQGTALAIQAGIGNFGVSVVQFVTPWIITVSLLGGATFLGEAQVMTRNGVETPVYMQNATAVFIPFIVIFGLSALAFLKSVPVKANFGEQMDIFRSRHTWAMTSLYMMTFGAFAGLAGTFPLLIAKSYGGLENAPDPLAFAFLGPLVGSLLRVVGGPVSDRFGGARVTQVAGLGMVACAATVPMFTTPDSVAEFPFFVMAMLGLFAFSGVGNASTFKQMPMIFPPRQAGGVIGFTAAIAAYGPFVFGMMFAGSFAAYGNPNVVFYGLAVFFAFNVVLNWWMYARRNAATPC
ncbi:MAG: MFS transporter [Salinarimonas sp.]